VSRRSGKLDTVGYQTAKGEMARAAPAKRRARADARHLLVSNAGGSLSSHVAPSLGDPNPASAVRGPVDLIDEIDPE
jgi:hypothetical protein